MKLTAAILLKCALGFIFFTGLARAGDKVEILEFRVLQEAYEKKLDSLWVEIVEKEIAPLVEKYDVALARLEDAGGKAGDLEAVVAVRAERRRAAEEKWIKKDQISKQYAAIAKLQKQLLERVEKIDEGKKKKYAEVGKTYVKKLEELKVRYTKLKKIEQAVIVDAEIKKMAAELKAKAPKRLFGQEEEEEAVDRSKFEGVWVVTRYDGYVLGNVNISKAGKNKVSIADGNKFLKGMLGDYTVEGRNLRKVKKDGDTSWDVFWQPDRRDFLSAGKHFPKYRLSRAKDAETDKGEDK